MAIQPSESPILKVVDLLEFMAVRRPAREFIISPFIRQRNLVQIAAKRWNGKTYIGLSLALAIASGSPILGFSVPRPRRVLFAEPEMDGRDLQDRISAIQSGLTNPVQSGYFRLACHDENPNGLFNLALPEGCAKFDAQVGNAEVIFLDSKKYLCYVREENSADGYTHFHHWLMRQRHTGRTVIMSTHMGKSANGARGSSAQEDLLDVCVQLSRTEASGKGLDVLWEFTKGRGLSAEDQEDFTVQLRIEAGRAELVRSANSNAIDHRTQVMLDMCLAGLSHSEIADEFGIHRTTVSRTINNITNLKAMHQKYKNNSR